MTCHVPCCSFTVTHALRTLRTPYSCPTHPAHPPILLALRTLRKTDAGPTHATHPTRALRGPYAGPTQALRMYFTRTPTTPLYCSIRTTHTRSLSFVRCALTPTQPVTCFMLSRHFYAFVSVAVLFDVVIAYSLVIRIYSRFMYVCMDCCSFGMCFFTHLRDGRLTLRSALFLMVFPR